MNDLTKIDQEDKKNKMREETHIYILKMSFLIITAIA